MKLISIFILSLLIFSCKKPPVEQSITSIFTNGFLIVNEGLFQQNNASLAFYSNETKEISLNTFSKVNGRGLGDTANDMIAFTFNGRPYYAIAVNGSSQIEIIEGLTLKSVAQIGLFENGIAREPRTLQFYNNFLYSINFDGTVSIISMESLSETNTIKVGQNPESSLIYQNSLFVVNTGGLNFPNYDSTISVIDLQTNDVTSTFTADINGSELLVDNEGEGYMISRGNFGTIKPKLLRLDIENNTVKEEYPINIIIMAYFNEIIYYYSDEADAILKFNTANETTSQTPFIDCSNFENVYKIIIHEDQQLIYIVDANGYVNSSIIRIYNFDGNFQREIISGLNTNNLLFAP